MDILFLSIPKLELCAPLNASAILTAKCKEHKFTAKFIDLNIRLWRDINVEEFGKCWYPEDLTFHTPLLLEEFWKSTLKELFQKYCDSIKMINPRWIGITMFCDADKHLIKLICSSFKECGITSKIVIGGPGARNSGFYLFSDKIIDAYISGEGEDALISLLNGELNYPGINGIPPIQLNDLEKSVPIPDYSDIDFSLYIPKDANPETHDHPTSNSVYITGSRGCVRRCDFCDVNRSWPKFRYRSGVHLAAEIKQCYVLYGSTHFLFTDSLINGSVSQLIEFCNTIIEQKGAGILPDILRFRGQFIARSEKQMPESVYELMKRAGFYSVAIGIESGSELVRNEMKKMFTNEDLDFTLTQCNKYQIKMAWLLMVGHPSETEEEFQKTLDFLERLKWMNASNYISYVSVGRPLVLLKDTAIAIKLNSNAPTNRLWELNGNTYKIRVNRWQRLRQAIIDLGYPCVDKEVNKLKSI